MDVCDVLGAGDGWVGGVVMWLCFGWTTLEPGNKHNGKMKKTCLISVFPIINTETLFLTGNVACLFYDLTTEKHKSLYMNSREAI